jgi:hypothetical protein
VPDRAAFPDLVVRTDDLAPFLRLALHDATVPSAPVGSIDQVLIEAVVTPELAQRYRARFLVRHYSRRELEIRFPGPLERLQPEFYIDGRRLNQATLLAGDASVVQLAWPPGARADAAILEIRYQAPTERAAASDIWRTALRPPILGSDLVAGRIHWLVHLPPDWIAIAQEGCFSVDPEWTWGGGLFVPQDNVGGIERWPGDLDAGQAPWSHALAAESAIDTLAAWSPALQPIRLLHLTRPIWLLSCSLILVVAGLLLISFPLPRYVFWPILGVIGLFGLATEVWQPRLVAAVIYGSEPGILVLGLLVAVQWILRRRYQRQVVFLPSFTRLNTGSSHNQRHSSLHKRREPSTVDVLPKKESSVK